MIFSFMLRKNKSNNHFENFEFVNDCLKVIFGDVLCRFSLDYRLNFRLAMEVLYVVLGVD